MFIPRALFTGIFAALAVSASAIEQDDVFSILLKRQQPGTPAYDCYNSCGQAIKLSRESDDPCTDEAFLTNYAACLECAGPDDFDIWKHYGNTLSAAGEKCGLGTTPGEGGSDDSEEPPAVEEPTATDTPEEPAPSATADDSDPPAPSATEEGEASPSGTAPVEAGGLGARSTLPAASVVALGFIALFF